MDDGTEAEFAVDADGRIKKIFVFAGGLLSLFGGENGRGTKIVSANASATIRGTTTYFSWQNESQRTYVCCCYGHLDLENDKGGSTLGTYIHGIFENDLWRESYINLIRHKKGLPLLDKERKNYKIKRDSIIENLAFQFKKYINLSELLN